MPETPPSSGSSRSPTAKALLLAGALGVIIAVPAFVLGFGGAYLDKAIGSGPWGMLAGFLCAFCVSAFAVVRLVKSLEVVQQPKI